MGRQELKNALMIENLLKLLIKKDIITKKQAKRIILEGELPPKIIMYKQHEVLP